MPPCWSLVGRESWRWQREGDSFFLSLRKQTKLFRGRKDWGGIRKARGRTRSKKDEATGFPFGSGLFLLSFFSFLFFVPFTLIHHLVNNQSCNLWNVNDHGKKHRITVLDVSPSICSFPGCPKYTSNLGAIFSACRTSPVLVLLSEPNRLAMPPVECMLTFVCVCFSVKNKFHKTTHMGQVSHEGTTFTNLLGQPCIYTM